MFKSILENVLKNISTLVTTAFATLSESTGSLKVQVIFPDVEQEVADALTVLSDTVGLLKVKLVLPDVEQEVADAFAILSDTIGLLDNMFGSLIKTIDQVVVSTKEFYTPVAAAAIAQYVIDIGNVIYAFRYLSEQLETATSNVEKEVTSTVNNIARSILSLKTLIPSMFVYGAGMMFSFISGIRAWVPVLEAQLIAIANMIKAYLGVQSPTELGALKDIEAWPKNLVKSFASGIKSEMNTLNNSFSGMTLGAPGGGGGGGNKTTNVVFNVTQNIKDKSTADYSTQELEKMLNRHQLL
jgi:phage-related protein